MHKIRINKKCISSFLKDSKAYEHGFLQLNVGRGQVSRFLLQKMYIFIDFIIGCQTYYDIITFNDKKDLLDCN